MAARFIRGSENGDDAQNVCLLNILSFSLSYFFFQNKVFFKPRNVVPNKMAASTYNATLLRYKFWRDVVRVLLPALATCCATNSVLQFARKCCEEYRSDLYLLQRLAATCNMEMCCSTSYILLNTIFLSGRKLYITHTKVYDRTYFYFMDGSNDLFCRLVANYLQVLLKQFRAKRLSWRCSANSPGKPSNGIRRNFYAKDLTFRNRTLRQKRSA